MVKFLEMPVSMLKKPSPRSVFRLPVWPGIVSWKPASAVFGSLHRLGAAAPDTAWALCELTGWGMGFPLGVAYPLSCQLVAQREPFETEKGRPEVWRQVVVTSHPPTMALRARFICAPNCWPRPKGRW